MRSCQFATLSWFFKIGFVLCCKNQHVLVLWLSSKANEYFSSIFSSKVPASPHYKLNPQRNAIKNECAICLFSSNQQIQNVITACFRSRSTELAWILGKVNENKIDVRTIAVLLSLYTVSPLKSFVMILFLQKDKKRSTLMVQLRKSRHIDFFGVWEQN